MVKAKEKVEVPISTSFQNNTNNVINDSDIISEISK
jgi:hypothetical protein